MAENDDYSVKFGDQQLLVEHPVGSGIFGAPCGITGLTKQVQTNTADIDLPPCNDPYAVVWLGIDPTSKRMTLTFSGTLADSALPIWDEWSMSDQGRRKIRWYRNLSGPNRGYWEGYGVLTDYSEETTSRGRYTNSGTIIFDGKPVWVDIPPAPNVTTSPTLPNITPVVGTAFTAVAGTATAGATSTYQWYRNGVLIPGATALAYTPVAADIGFPLYMIQTFANAGGTMSAPTLYSARVIEE